MPERSVMGPVEALRELAGTLADVLECGDLRGHLVAWWDVVTGQVDVDSPTPVCICSESGSLATLADDSADRLTLTDIYRFGWSDGVDGVLCENPYTDPERHDGYAMGRRDGERHYRECTCFEPGSPAALAGDHAGWCPAAR